MVADGDDRDDGEEEDVDGYDQEERKEDAAGSDKLDSYNQNRTCLIFPSSFSFLFFLNAISSPLPSFPSLTISISLPNHTPLSPPLSPPLPIPYSSTYLPSQSPHHCHFPFSLILSPLTHPSASFHVLPFSSFPLSHPISIFLPNHIPSNAASIPSPPTYLPSHSLISAISHSPSSSFPSTSPLSSPPIKITFSSVQIMAVYFPSLFFKHLSPLPSFPAFLPAFQSYL